MLEVKDVDDTVFTNFVRDGGRPFVIRSLGFRDSSSGKKLKERPQCVACSKNQDGRADPKSNDRDQGKPGEEEEKATLEIR